MDLQLEARRDPEVRARATQTPEQLRLLVRGGPHEAPVGCHELDRMQAVDRQAEAALEPSDAATERQPGDARVTDDPHRADEPVLLGRDIELAQQGTAAGASKPTLRVDADVIHPPEVDDEAAIAGRMPDGAVAAAANGDLEVALATEADGRDDILGVRRSDDHGWPAVEGRVPDTSGVVVARGIRRDDVPRERAAELIDLGGGWRRGS